MILNCSMMDDTITRFIQRQSVVTLCCVDQAGKPFCFPVFFAFDSGEGVVYFKSSPESYHSRLLEKNPAVSGSILPDKLNVLALKGVQFEGTLINSDNDAGQISSKIYYSKHPLAMVIPGQVYAIRILSIKMTGAKGFGKKISWKREVA